MIAQEEQKTDPYPLELDSPPKAKAVKNKGYSQQR